MIWLVLVFKFQISTGILKENCRIISWYRSNLHLQNSGTWYTRCVLLTTKNHNIRPRLDCFMTVSSLSQITDITPTSVFVFSNYWKLTRGTLGDTTNDKNTIVCWDCSIAPNSKKKLFWNKSTIINNTLTKYDFHGRTKLVLQSW